MALTDSFTSLRAGFSTAVGQVLERPIELAEQFVACLPEAIRKLLAQRDRKLIIEPQTDPESASLFLSIGGERQAMGALDLDGHLPLPSDVAGGAQEQTHRTVLMLPADVVLRRPVSFPAQVRDNLPQVMRYELDRLSPFQSDQVIYDFALQGGPAPAGRINLELALCRRDRVEGWIQRLREAGSPIEQITWEGAWPKANLLAPEDRPRRRTALFDLKKLLWALALLLLAAALATPLWQKARLVESLDKEIANIRTKAVEVDDLRQELERARRGSTAVLQQKWDRPRIMDLLLELSERIPDDTWVQSLEYQDGEVQLRGESGQATALIALLEQAPGIDGVSFRSPVTQVARTGKERFNLAFTYTQPPKE